MATIDIVLLATANITIYAVVLCVGSVVKNPKIATIDIVRIAITHGTENTTVPTTTVPTALAVTVPTTPASTTKTNFAGVVLL